MVVALSVTANMYADDKSVQVTETYESDGIPETGRKAGTVDDRDAMRRLGKQQQFKVGLSCLVRVGAG